MNQAKKALENIAIVGGGAEAWLAAAMLSRSLAPSGVRIRLVDTGGLQAGAIPLLHHFPGLLLGLRADERAFMRETAATFRLSTRFVNWNKAGHHFQVPCGAHGASIDAVAFNHFALKERLAGFPVDFNSYSLAAAAADSHRFSHPVNDPNSILSTLAYGYNVNSSRFSGYFRAMAENLGVEIFRSNGLEVVQDETQGFIQSIHLEDGRSVEADLFVDCSGPRALLIGDALDSPWVDCSLQVPGNRMLEVFTGRDDVLASCSTVEAIQDGWIQGLPLSEAGISRFFFNDQVLNDENAWRVLQERLAGQAASEPEFTALRPGYRRSFWDRNCVAMGAAASEMDPLTGCDLHLVLTAVSRLMDLLPGTDCDPVLSAEYNRQTTLEYQNAGDYAQIHYLYSERPDSPFWSRGSASPVSDSLAYKLRLFGSHGQMAFNERETFDINAWVAALIGQQQWPQDYDPVLDSYDFSRLRNRFETMRRIIDQAVREMPDHGAYLAQYSAP